MMMMIRKMMIRTMMMMKTRRGTIIRVHRGEETVKNRIRIRSGRKKEEKNEKKPRSRKT